MFARRRPPGGTVTQPSSRAISAIAAAAAVFVALAFDAPAMAAACQRQESHMDFLRTLHTRSLNRAHAAREDYQRFCPGNGLCETAAMGVHSLENDAQAAHRNLQAGIQQYQTCLADARGGARPYAGSGRVGNVDSGGRGNRNRNDNGPYVNRYGPQDAQGGGQGRRGRGDGNRNRNNNNGPYVNRYSPQDVQGGGGQGRRGRGDGNNRNRNNDGNTYINRYSPQDTGGGQGGRGRGDRNRNRNNDGNTYINRYSPQDVQGGGQGGGGRGDRNRDRNRDRRGQGGQNDGYASEPPPRY
jgi:hypothetical protein